MPQVKRSKCSDCQHYWQCLSEKQIVKGVAAQFGEKYCLAKSRARKIRRKDPTSCPPDWCPNYLNPPILLIFALKEDQKYYHQWDRMQAQNHNRDVYPMAYRYELRMETVSPISAYHLYHDVQDMQTVQSVSLNDISQILRSEVRGDEVLEINDGIKPAFFYLDTLHGLDMRLISFEKEWIDKK